MPGQEEEHFRRRRLAIDFLFRSASLAYSSPSNINYRQSGCICNLRNLKNGAVYAAGVDHEILLAAGDPDVRRRLLHGVRVLATRNVSHSERMPVLRLLDGGGRGVARHRVALDEDGPYKINWTGFLFDSTSARVFVIAGAPRPRRTSFAQR